MNSLSVIITGASGMVGEGVLHECLNSEKVDKVLVIGRRPCGTTHPKMKEIIHADFFNLSPIKEDLKGYNACMFCLGVSSIGLKEPEFRHLTYDLTLHCANMMLEQNPGMQFCYISGGGTDETEKGRQMWARVKGKTENDLIAMNFSKVYCFRPGYMQPTSGLKNTLKYYAYISWMYPALRMLFPGFVGTLKELGLAMINACYHGFEKNRVEVKDIKLLSQA